MAPITMRPIRETIPLAQALDLLLRDVKPIDRTERVPLERAGGRDSGEDDHVAGRRAAVRRAAMDGYAVIAADTFGAGAHDPKSAAPAIDEGLHRQVPRHAPVDAGECIEIATGAPMPAGRRRGRDGRGDRTRRRRPRRARASRRSTRGRTSAAARADIAAGQTGPAAGRRAERRAASARWRRSARSTSTSSRDRGRDTVDRQRDRRARAAARAGPDLRHQPLHAGGDRRRARRRRRSYCRPRRTRSTTLDGGDRRRARPTTSSCSPAAARSASAT